MSTDVHRPIRPEVVVSIAPVCMKIARLMLRDLDAAASLLAAAVA